LIKKQQPPVEEISSNEDELWAVFLGFDDVYWAGSLLFEGWAVRGCFLLPSFDLSFKLCQLHIKQCVINDNIGIKELREPPFMRLSQLLKRG